MPCTQFPSWPGGTLQSAFMGRPARELRAGQANIGGYRMTEAAAEASELASVSVARPGDAVARETFFASLVGFA